MFSMNQKNRKLKRNPVLVECTEHKLNRERALCTQKPMNRRQVNVNERIKSIRIGACVVRRSVSGGGGIVYKKVPLKRQQTTTTGE